MLTPADIEFCKTVCRTASQLGVKVRRYNSPQVHATAFEFRTPSGELIRGTPWTGMNEPLALHSACKALSEHLL